MDAAFLELAAQNLRRERNDNAIQTALDEWADRAETDARLVEAAREVDIASEPRVWIDVVSFGPAAVIGFLYKSQTDDRRVVFS